MHRFPKLEDEEEDVNKHRDEEEDSGDNNVRGEPKLTTAERRLKTIKNRITRISNLFEKPALTDDEVVELVFGNANMGFTSRSKLEDISLGTLGRGFRVYDIESWVGFLAISARGVVPDTKSNLEGNTGRQGQTACIVFDNLQRFKDP